ncbi:cation channel sperm-associated protein subunit delta-domain-containing protein [Catenaria anguillulae PL171]|uniref:Cation channel sperm-associated protein subunit delta-domain-containing protein n=1 Tax=Catenaria anguillulae PL171 TaxID=765915 RepID=A0A1Y2HM74_9FUNG|nr:cation channel sperm-associated protein subunit delta-domain-containing protein [Catenaria anguillulae PL171]
MVRATCPPDRRIALRAVPASVAAPVLVNCTANPSATLSVTAAEGTWRDWDSGKLGSGSKTSQFSCARYGQPQAAYYSYQWAPVLDVYEGNKVVGNVTADFALVEVTGRNTFAYVLTADAVGCRRMPQGAVSVLSSSSGGAGWTRNNFRSCFSSVDSAFTSSIAASTPYEIFNRTNGNKLTWGNSENALYMFRATVLDPQFSYCTLSTEFAVQVYGAPLPAGTQVGIVVGFIVAVLAALAASYWVYRRNKTKEKTD